MEEREQVKEEKCEQAQEQEAQEVEELKKRVEELEKEKEEIYDRLLRLHAEFENFRKRTQRELEKQIELANERLIRELLIVVDNFERALEAVDEDSSAKGFVEGVRLIYRQLKDLLQRFGVEEIEAEGKEFDPMVHEAVMQVEDEEKDNIVVQEVQKGYKLKGKLIRPSKVVVSRKKAS